MDWTKFNNHGESPNHAFEVMCNILFKCWLKKEYKDNISHFAFVNGSGGDGGVEAYGLLKSGDIIGVQSKWFPQKMEASQFKQIENSFYTAIKVRPELKRYIVCIPRDFTSKKMVKNNQVARDTEESKWINLCENINKEYPDVVIELWDETSIQEKLCLPETQGCYRYWFECSDVFETEILTSYQRAINSWAKTKYIPDLYSTGYIHDKLSSFTGSFEATKKKYDMTQNIYAIVQKLKRAYEDILRLQFPENEKALFEKVKSDISVLGEWLCIIREIGSLVASGSDIERDNFEKKFELNCDSSELKDSSLHFSYYNHFHEVESILDNIEDDFEQFKRCMISDSHNKIIFLGNQGTGKTAGIVSEIDLMLQDKSFLPVLVQAKDYRKGDSWLSILTRTIGLSTTWSELELFQALENAALLRNRYLNESCDIVVQPKCLICVDGIDEASSWSFWKERIEETQVYEGIFPNVKFVFLSRPYVFPRYYDLDYRECFYTLPSSGDVSVNELFDDYIAFYKIDLCGNYWIKEILSTPMALKLFCDLYGNSSVGNLDKNSLVITKLFQKKINSVEESYRKQEKETNQQSMIKTILVNIATLLTNKNELTFEDIFNESKEPIKSHLEDLLFFIEKEGFIYSHQICEDEFSEPVIVYSWGMQPAFDYLIGRKLYDAIRNGKNIQIEYTNGIYQMLSLIVIEEDGKLISEYSNIKLEESVLFDLICYTLANTSVEIASKYRDYVKKLMHYSEAEFREIVNRVIIPVSEINNHPLGGKLLDEFLRGFDKPAQRDIWWSIPTYLRNNYNASWRTFSELDLSMIALSDKDNYMGKPLILVWRLSSVDNDVRRDCRLKLTEWGINNPYEYLDLLLYCADINDEQIVEDIFAIAYGIALGKFVQKEYLEKLSSWIVENVYSEEGLFKYENSAIRYYCKGIVKIAISKGLCDAECEKRISEKYIRKSSFMPAYKDSFDSKRLSGYGPIYYDLARYVLCDHLDRFFCINYKTREYLREAEEFIEKYKKKYDVDMLEPEGLIISIAFQYLLNQGWDEKIFWECEDKNNLGIDICIRNTYMRSTHGAKSKVMTVAEKYVWCVKHRMEAVFASQRQYNYYGQGVRYISDYYEIDDFTNTYQDYVNSRYTKIEDKWIHTDQMVKTPYKEFSAENIEKWMKKKDTPDFTVWLGEKTDARILYAYTNIVNEVLGIEEAIWISSGIVKNNDFEKLIAEVNVYSEERSELLNVAEFHSYVETCGFYTPQEVCAVQSVKEANESINIGNEKNVIQVYKLVATCLSEHIENIEKTFYLPSRIARILTGITYGDGYEYINDNNEVVCKYSDVSKGENNQQECLQINSHILESSLKENDYRMFWVFRVYRSPSSKAYELYGNDITHDTDRSYIVWFDEEKSRYIELKEIEPVIAENNNDYVLKVKSLYDGLDD